MHRVSSYWQDHIARQKTYIDLVRLVSSESGDDLLASLPKGDLLGAMAQGG
jgi:hypothetical protein